MRWRIAALAVALAGGACGGGEEPSGSGSTPDATGEVSPPTVVRQWVAVFDTAGHPDDLDPSTEELLEAVGGSVAVQPVQCWKGLADDLGVDAGAYAAAVIAESEEDLAEVIEEVGREPTGTGEYRAFCLD